jgi:hypothetical protein
MLTLCYANLSCAVLLYAVALCYILYANAYAMLYAMYALCYIYACYAMLCMCYLLLELVHVVVGCATWREAIREAS